MDPDLKGIRQVSVDGGSNKKYRVVVSVNGVDSYVGCFLTQQEAIRARDERRNERRARGEPAPKKKKVSHSNAVETSNSGGVCYDAVRTLNGQTIYGGRYETKEAAQTAAAALVAPVLSPELAAMSRCPAPGITLRFARKRGAPKNSPLVARFVTRVIAGARTGRDYHVGTFDTIEEAKQKLEEAKLGGASRHAAIAKFHGGETCGDLAQCHITGL